MAQWMGKGGGMTQTAWVHTTRIATFIHCPYNIERNVLGFRIAPFQIKHFSYLMGSNPS